ncbi:MAG: amidase, partial [Paracoccaceae bacterium]|nr:amidase [Paracoccaceae bacterium]
MSDLTALSASELSARLACRATSAVEVMQAHLDRIDRLNPAINAIVALQDRDALIAAARTADAAPPKGWLHGIPMAVKDLTLVKGIRSTSGSPIFADLIPTEDDMLARTLRAAGALFIGKTNTPEFGLGSHSFNPIYGATRTPYDLTRAAGGSSGGAAAALAARLIPIADGSDMMGSLRNPAAFCNVYGFRPSYGLVPFDPLGDTFLHQLSTNGPMARTVEDLARLLEILAHSDPRLPHSRTPEPYADALDIDPKGKRIGWLGDWGGAYQVEPGILDLCQSALKTFEAMGCIVEALAPPFPAAKIWDSWTTLRSFAIAGSTAPLRANPKTRALLKPEMVWEIERGLALTAMEVHRASVIRSEWFTTLAKLFENYDALVLPSAQVWPFPVEWRYPEAINGHAMDTYH